VADGPGRISHGLGSAWRRSSDAAGDLYAGRLDQTHTYGTLTPPDYRTTFTKPTEVTGDNLLGRWSHEYSADANSTLQAYYDRTWRETVYLTEQRNTFDVDFQNRFVLLDRHEVMWGAGYRLSQDQLRNSFLTSFDPRVRHSQLFNFFLQDDITLVRDRLR